MSKRLAFFLAPEAPYPLAGGGSLRSASLLEYLARNFEVDALVFHAPGPKPVLPSGLVNRLRTIELPRHSKRFAARWLRNADRLRRNVPPLVDRFSGFGAPLDAFLHDAAPYDLGVVEHFWCAPYWEQLAPRCRNTILDLHNIESAWHLACGPVARWPHSRAHAVFYR